MEEIVDVRIMLDQLIDLLEVDENEVEEIYGAKVRRTVARLGVVPVKDYHAMSREDALDEITNDIERKLDEMLEKKNKAKEGKDVRQDMPDVQKGI